jgi:alpha-amylase
MTSVCFYFEVHQPFRLRPYSFFDIGTNHFYLDDVKNKAILDKVASKCYLPANKTMLELIKRHNGKFKISYSLSGVFIEQCELYRPDVLQSFIDLAKTGCVEFLSETYYHSLSYIFSKKEFDRQVELHAEKIKKHFNQTPKVFRNTELIYNNELANYIEKKGYKGILCEGVDRLLGYRNSNFVYRPAGAKKIKALLKNYRLSDDIAFRFSDRNWAEFPLTADKFANWVHNVAGNGDVINLFMDYETFGEHQWESTGIFQFLEHMPGEIIKHPDFNFKTPTEVCNTVEAKGEYDAHDFISWADTERDLSAWRSNTMQEEALQRIYSLEAAVKATGDDDLLNIWAKLTTSDHFYYMSTKYWADGDVHKYFSPYDSPYDAYIYFMNALSDLEQTIAKAEMPKKNVKKPTGTKTAAKKAAKAKVK